ncbi:hypothetical protein [Amycolatopsis sp. NPDC006125]|uniref:AMIN-like domain-containing (lipo)protein n=1 Tax=Amycolatopsis sp. NPDC006125 TaxID=3156730 RepID=UPI0033B58133
MRTLLITVAAAVALALTTGCGADPPPAPRPGAPAGSSIPAPVISPQPPGPGPMGRGPMRTAPPGPGGCGITAGWTTWPQEAGAMAPEALYLVRAGQHGCFDRLVFDVNGPEEAGYALRYTDVVTADGSGEPVPVAGGAALEIVVRAPALGYDSSGHAPGRLLAAVGDRLYTTDQLRDWAALHEVRFAGSFEGQSTFAAGVRERLPFRVFTVLDDSYRRVVVDVAH